MILVILVVVANEMISTRERTKKSIEPEQEHASAYNCSGANASKTFGLTRCKLLNKNGTFAIRSFLPVPEDFAILVLYIYFPSSPVRLHTGFIRFRSSNGIVIR